MKREVHNIEPVYDAGSRVLILGSFPSVKSREAQFFYGHKQNRFWKVIAALVKNKHPDTKVPVTVEEKKKLLIENHIAVWDVIASCEIEGSSDSSIQNVIANDINLILNNAHIEKIYANGAKAHQLYKKYCQPHTDTEAVKLPSTSPANAACSLDKLIIEWKDLLNYIDN